MLHKRGVKFDVITAGRKLMQVVIPRLKIRIIDSLNFIPAPLAKFPKIFGIEGATKGMFPYRFNTKSNWNYRGDMPPFEYYLPEGTTIADLRLDQPVNSADLDDDEGQLLHGLQQRKLWYDETVAKGYTYVHFEELRRYCNNDTWLLYVSVQKFRDAFLSQTATEKWSFDKEDPQSTSVDPFNNVTIASAVMSAFRHKFLDRDTIAYLAHSTDVHSRLSIQWLEYTAHCDQLRIRHARNGGEVWRAGMKVDGFCASTNMVYEFNGCFWHGCPKCYPARSHLYQRQKDKEAKLRAQGYHVVTMWECAFRDLQVSDANFQEFMRKHPAVREKLPLNVREAFFGGRTNASCLYYKCDPTKGEFIKYLDFTSLYPWVNKFGIYPIGHPEIILNPSLVTLRKGLYFGIAKCRVVPPRNLYHPVLPTRLRDHLMFTLCRTCAEDESAAANCQHNDNERAISGTWCTPEIDLAISKGYKITNVFEVHHFDEDHRVQGLFADFVNTFLKAKQEASGWPRADMSDAEKNAYIDDYLDHEDIQLDRASIEKKPGWRQVAKLMLTSLWGKFGQGGNMPQTKVCTTMRDLRAIMFNGKYEILSADPCP